MFCRKPLITSVSLALLSLPFGASADGWLLQPSITFDIGYDDNYDMDTTDPESVGVAKVTGELGVRRLSEAHYFKGGLLVDGVTYAGGDDVEANSNQVAYFNTTFRQPRSQWGANFRYRRDSLLREAVSDDDTVVSQEEELDATVDQLLDVTRQRVYFNPFASYNLTRLTDIRADYQLSTVDHDLDDDEVYDVTDYTNQGASLKLSHSLTTIDKVSVKVGGSLFATDVDEDETEYKTTYLRLGYDRSISPTFTVGGDLGYHVTDFDQGGEDVEDDGLVGSLKAVKTTGLTRFELRAGLELYPSSIGQVVETRELVGNMTRSLSELLTFSLRSRFYENKGLSGSETVFGTNESATAYNNRRSMTIRPELKWKISREWTLGAAYRYQREKLDSKPDPAEGNAVLFSVRYTYLTALSENQ
ncbi:hypothetical protein Q4485_09960 [Granulosicoccaceae sp. 1_MG-2023]|nr:hypothetical protein [Granulosicoccaceae sp. 1_MG-2023]